MIVTALLVRWMGGWRDVTDDAAVTRWGRKEAMLGLGAVEETSEVDTVSREQLAIFGDPLTEISCDTLPVGEPDTPYIAYRPGDTVIVPNRAGLPPAPERVQSITATMDDDGRVTYATELRDVLMDERERFAENLTKLANGSMGGNSKVAQPTNMTPSRDHRTTLEPAKWPGTWSLHSNTLPEYHGWTNERTEHWVSDGTHHPVFITVEGNHLAGNPIRVALVTSGEGTTAVGPVVMFRGDTVSMSYEPSLRLTTGVSYWLYTQGWDEGQGDAQIHNLIVTVTMEGNHPNVPLPWAPTPT